MLLSPKQSALYMCLHSHCGSWPRPSSCLRSEVIDDGEWEPGVEFALQNKRFLMSRIDGCKLGRSPTQVHTYDFRCWRRPIIMTNKSSNERVSRMRSYVHHDARHLRLAQATRTLRACHGLTTGAMRISPNRLKRFAPRGRESPLG